MIELLYYPGCTLKTSGKNLETSALMVAEALGYKLVEMEEWNCCGVTLSSLTKDDLMHHLAPLRNLVHAADQHNDTIITLCDMCFNTLKQTNLRVKDKPEDLETLNNFMDQENDYNNSVRVLHFLEFLRDDIGFQRIKKMVKKPLKGLKVMPYYGCMLLRPREVAIDDAEDPTILKDLMEALGAEVVDNPYKVECCGSYRTIDKKDATRKRAHHITNYAVERGAEAVVLSCPLCSFNLDTRGKEAEEAFEGYSQVPVFYYTQLIAIALGLDPGSCDFSSHAVDPIPILKAKGVI